MRHTRLPFDSTWRRAGRAVFGALFTTLIGLPMLVFGIGGLAVAVGALVSHWVKPA